MSQRAGSNGTVLFVGGARDFGRREVLKIESSGTSAGSRSQIIAGGAEHWVGEESGLEKYVNKHEMSSALTAMGETGLRFEWVARFPSPKWYVPQACSSCAIQHFPALILLPLLCRHSLSLPLVLLDPSLIPDAVEPEPAGCCGSNRVGCEARSTARRRLWYVKQHRLRALRTLNSAVLRFLDDS